MCIALIGNNGIDETPEFNPSIQAILEFISRH
jgi:hypothetical protein